MSNGVLGVVVSHADLGRSLVAAVAAIAGRTDGLVAVSNDGCGRDGILERITIAVPEGPAVIFVDLPGGSCFAAALRLQRQRDDLRVVGGVNLPMLLDFVMNPPETAAEAAGRAVEVGGRAIAETAR